MGLRKRRHRNGTGRRPAEKWPACLQSLMITNMTSLQSFFFVCFVLFFDSLHVSKMLFLCPTRNPSASPQGAHKVSSDLNKRIQSLSFLVQQIRTYYQVRLASWWLCSEAAVLSEPLGHFKPCSSIRAGAACVPADQLALLKSRALNISRVHICVIGTDLWAGLSVSEHPSTVKDKQNKNLKS